MSYPDKVEPLPLTVKETEFGMDAALRGLRERGYYPPVVLDIGAAVGSWTESALRYWPHGEYYCIEALDERHPNLQALVERTGANVKILACGVADIDGVLEMGVTESLWDSSFAYQGSEMRHVNVFTLDTLFASNRIVPPSLLKLDVQGFEKKIISGGESALKHCSVILMECSFYPFCPSMGTLDDTIAFMSRRGYVPYEFVDLLRRPLDRAMGQCDIIFVRKNHWLIANTAWS